MVIGLDLDLRRVQPERSTCGLKRHVHVRRRSPGSQRTARKTADNEDSELVIEIVQQMDIELFAPTKTVIDPACGDGQFLIVALGIKMFHFGMSREDALKDIYGVDIMRDNVDLCKRRLGGGNIVMGNTLDPNTPLDGQTPDEARLMRDWFSNEATLEDFFG